MRRIIANRQFSHLGDATRNVYSDHSTYPYNSEVLSEDGWIHSTGHKRNKAGFYDRGGPFYLRREGVYKTPSAPVEAWIKNTSVPEYVGSFTADDPGAFDWGYPADESENPAFRHGADAWAHARDRLTNPDFSILQPIAEARELPRLLRFGVRDLLRKTRSPKYRDRLNVIGEYHLAMEFGWKPMWRDLGSFLKGHKTAEKRANQLIRDNGRSIKREGELKNYSSTSSYKQSHANRRARPILNNASYWWSGESTYSAGSADRIWYSGKFRYYLPDWENRNCPRYKKRLMRALYSNYRLTPSAAYNLIPWSWLVDWYSDLGVFFDAVSGGVEERLIADYFYVMRHSTNFREHRAVFTVKNSKEGTSPSAVIASTLRKKETKARSVASPFGFGLSEESLSGTQLGILGALGLSRL